MESSILNRADNSADVDISIVKVVSFMVLAIISAGVAGYFLAEASLIYGLIALFAFWVIFALQVFFIKDWTRILILTFLEAVAMIAPGAIIFSDNFSGFVFLALGALFALFLSAESAGRSELANSLRIPLWRAMRHVASKVITATLVFTAILYIFIADKSIVATEGAKALNTVIVTPVVRTVIPDFVSGMSLDDVLLKIMERQLGKTAFQNLSAAQKAEALRSTKQALTNYIGEIDSKAPLGTAIYDYFAIKLTSAPLPVKGMVGLVLIAMLWGIIKLVALLLFMPVAALASFVYEMLIVLNFIVIQYESRSREIILLK